MTFQKKLMEMSDGPVKLLATATTGLEASDDLLAVAIMELDASGKRMRNTLVIQRIEDRDKLLKAQQFHGISWDRMMQAGVDREAFRMLLAERLGEGTVFSYNPGFQLTYLSKYMVGGSYDPSSKSAELKAGENTTRLAMHNLPLLFKGAETRYALLQGQAASLKSLEEFYAERLGKIPSFKKVCEQAGVVCSDPTLLPVEASCQMLYGLWTRLDYLPLNVQTELL